VRLSIVIPAHNEEHRLAPTLESYAAFYQERYAGDFEIIVVVNHSSDRTEALAKSIAGRFPGIIVVNEPRRIGKGGAVEMGFRMAKGEQVGFVDADGATSAVEFHKLVEGIGDAGCAIGSRWITGAEVNPRQSLVRRLASRVLNKVFVHALFGLKVYDSQCGAKLFRAEVLEKLLPVASEPGWAFDIDLLCRVQRLGYGIRELPIKWHHVPGNPTTFFVMGLQMLASVWRVRLALSRWTDPAD
jgi:glycosyltransferase involved in cell wall biosynthesis